MLEFLGTAINLLDIGGWGIAVAVLLTVAGLIVRGGEFGLYPGRTVQKMLLAANDEAKRWQDAYEKERARGDAQAEMLLQLTVVGKVAARTFETIQQPKGE